MSVGQLVVAADLSPTRRLSRVGWLTWAAAGFLALVALVAIFGPLIAPYDPDAVDVFNVQAGPSASHWLGTDDTGRDILSRIIVGTRATVVAPLFVVLLATLFGTLFAISAAWFRGLYDGIVTRGMDILFAFPGIIFAIVAVAVFGAGLVAPVIALSITYVPVLARVLRTAALRESSLPYVDALRVQGASGWTITTRHILPNQFPLVLVQSTMAFGYALLDLAAISYLGLGLQPPAADWGVLIASGQPGILAGHPEQSIAASLLVVLTVISVNLLGDRLSTHFEIGER